MAIKFNISNDPFLDEITSNAFGRDFKNSLKSTYSRRSRSSRPKTFREKAKRVGGFIPIVALTKAGIDATRKRQSKRPQRRQINRYERTEPTRNLREYPLQRIKQPVSQQQELLPVNVPNPNLAAFESIPKPIIETNQLKPPMKKGTKIALIAGGIAGVLVIGIIIFKKTR